MNKPIEALLITKGHWFDREPFFQMIDKLGGEESEIYIHWTHVEQPAAAALMHPDRARPFDVFVFYDMPGVKFTGSLPDRFAHYAPTEQYKSDFLSLLDSGKGMVFLHHAISSWPSWPDFGELLGARFHFLPGVLGGKSYPGSGYRFNRRQTITVLDTEHPITQGLGESFEITDETYLFPVLEDQVTPLLRSDFTFTAEHFHHGGDGFKEHPEASSLVGWTKMARNSPIAYIQPGHAPTAYENPLYRRLIENAVGWAFEEAG